METESLIVKQAGAEAFNSFIGYGDTVDYAQVEFKDAGVCNFTVDSRGTAKGTAKFTLYKLTQKSNGVWTTNPPGRISQAWHKTKNKINRIHPPGSLSRPPGGCSFREAESNK